MSKIKNAFGRINGRMHTVKEKMIALEYKVIETFQNEMHRKQGLKNQMNKVLMSCGTTANGLRYM